MNLGYCVVFDHGEQGWSGLVAVVCHENLSKAKSLVETISGYPMEHERYTQEVFNLTEMYHKHQLGQITDKDVASLNEYSPEAVYSILNAHPVDYSVQAFRPLGTRHWINRKWEVVSAFLTAHLQENALKRKSRNERQETL